MNKIVLKIGGMTCSSCSSGLEKYLKKQKGIINANVNLIMSIATIEYEDLKVKEIEEFISKAGFESLGEFKNIDDKELNKKDKLKLFIFGFLLIFLMYISMGSMLNLGTIPIFSKDYPVIYATVMLVVAVLFIGYGFNILKSGFWCLVHKMPNMDTLVLLSVTFSFLYSFYGYYEIVFNNQVMYFDSLYFESVCMIIYFIKLGRFIEDASKDKTKDAIRKLVQVTPNKATVIRDGKEESVSLDEVEIDDILVCRAGEKIAVDGIVVKGKAYVDESFITGESVPVGKKVDDLVIAGSTLYDSYIEYQAKKIGRDSTISEIVKMVVEATNTKGRIQRLADKICGYFVPVLMVIAVLTFIIQVLIGVSIRIAFIHLVTVLVVACPCALGLAVPLVFVVSNGLCASKGLYLRNSEVLEKARNIDTIVLDKTGTLTYGRLNVFKFYSYSKDRELLNIVSNIEKASSHPISTAFTITKKLEVLDFETYDGIGIAGFVEGKKYYLGNEKILKKLGIVNGRGEDASYLLSEGASIIYIVADKEILGLIGVKDTVRSDSKMMIDGFNKQGMDVVMLTGDHEVTAKIIAKEVGIETVVANVLPKDKASYVKELVASGKKVIMVGDGINDAPALVNATIGISVNDGTDVAMNTANVILMNNNLSNILDLIEISKKSYRIMRENLFWAFFYNLCMIPIAMGIFSSVGIEITPMIASIAMTISSLTVVFNSLRLGRKK